MGYAKKGDRIYTLGGNQGNMVSITAYPSNKLLGFRRLKNFSSKVGVPDPTLKKGSTGDMVKQLQDMLKIVGYECGTSDGIFGKATEKAVKKLQSSEGITADGIYGKSTKNLLTEALQA